MSYSHNCCHFDNASSSLCTYQPTSGEVVVSNQTMQNSKSLDDLLFFSFALTLHITLHLIKTKLALVLRHLSLVHLGIPRRYSRKQKYDQLLLPVQRYIQKLAAMDQLEPGDFSSKKPSHQASCIFISCN